MRIIETQLDFDDTAMSTTSVRVTDSVDVRQMNIICAQVTWTGTATGTLVLQGSNDGTNFETVATHSVTAAGTKILEDADVGYRYARVRYTNATNSGTLGQVYFVAKGIA